METLHWARLPVLLWRYAVKMPWLLGNISAMQKSMTHTRKTVHTSSLDLQMKTLSLERFDNSFLTWKMNLEFLNSNRLKKQVWMERNLKRRNKVIFNIFIDLLFGFVLFIRQVRDLLKIHKII